MRQLNQEEKQKLAAIAIEKKCDELKKLLLEKNEAYGNSAFEPVRCFSKSDPKELIRVRMDDKVSRLMRGSNAGEDVFWDLAGYAVLERAYDEYHSLVEKSIAGLEKYAEETHKD
jgi:hypothetical protein